MFPGGSAGVALCILRVCAIGGLALETTHPLSNTAGWQHYPAIVTAILLVLGVLTPAACSSCLLLEAWSLRISSSGADILFHMLATVALLLLGPGSYSVDAMLFGRRRILPPNG